MPEYSLHQAHDLAQMAIEAREVQANNGVRARNCLYLAHLSIELALKAALEQAGMSIASIRRLNHNLFLLSRAVGSCSFTHELGVGKGVVVRDLKATHGGGCLSFGYFVDATQWESISRYPGELRYGSDVNHFNPRVVAQLASELCKWLEARIHTFRLGAEVRD
ncbi:MAG: hypothetical protein HEQ37_11945 [Acidovorax sp.]|nr:hypothetical protein [Acidovorax sp.]